MTCYLLAIFCSWFFWHFIPFSCFWLFLQQCRWQFFCVYYYFFYGICTNISVVEIYFILFLYKNEQKKKHNHDTIISIIVHVTLEFYFYFKIIFSLFLHLSLVIACSNYHNQLHCDSRLGDLFLTLIFFALKKCKICWYISQQFLIFVDV